MKLAWMCETESGVFEMVFSEQEPCNDDNGVPFNSIVKIAYIEIIR